MRLFKWLTSGRPPEGLSEVIKAAPTMRTDHLGDGAWELDADDVLALRRKLTAHGQALKECCDDVFRGVTTGANDVFIITREKRDELVAKDARSEEIIKPFVQGTHVRPWYIENSEDFLIFTRRGIRIEDYPAILDYLEPHRANLEPKPVDWPDSPKWRGRKTGPYKWYEIQDTTAYWEEFRKPKILWPDITNRPRFVLDDTAIMCGDTTFMIPQGSHYLLGVLASWATWFFLSRTAQPLRLRSDRWQYRLKAQYVEEVPIPNASRLDRDAIATLAERSCDVASRRYELQTAVQRRLQKTFGEDSKARSLGTLNTKAQAWWELSLAELGTALKASFQLPASPFKNPRVADQWEPYLDEKRREVATLTKQLADAEAELNDRVFRLFNLTADEIKLLQREVEH
jgi:hypothetical protein